MNKPYIGVTGPVNESEVYATLSCFEDAGITMNTDHVPMIGFLVSYKTLLNPTMPHDTNRRYPRFSQVPSLVKIAHDKAFTTIHFNTSKERRTRLAEDIEAIFSAGNIYQNNWCRGLQLNVVWPIEDEVRKIRQKFDDLDIILQLSSAAMEGLTPKQIAYNVKCLYGDNLNHILIDPSGGRSKEFDISRSANIARALSMYDVDAVIGFTGGLSGDNVFNVVNRLIGNLGHESFSIDAEGKLRNKRSELFGDDDFNPLKVKDYVNQAAKALIYPKRI